MLSLTHKIPLNDGLKIPIFGLGTYLCRSGPGATAEKAVEFALQEGYRLFDTAEYYENEEDVGKALARSKIPREEIYVVTKLWDHGYDLCKKACERSLKKLNLKYIDLYLIHSPLGGRILETYTAMVELKEKGLVRSIGVSNFGVHHLEEIKKAGKPMPAVNQIELHMFCRQNKLVDYCRRNDIVVMGYTPLARGHYFDNPILKNIAQRHNKSPAQIMLRWSIQLGYVTIPKSEKSDRIKSNANIFDFALTEKDLEEINSLPNEAVTWNPVDSPWTD